MLGKPWMKRRKVFQRMEELRARRCPVTVAESSGDLDNSTYRKVDSHDREHREEIDDSRGEPPVPHRLKKSAFYQFHLKMKMQAN